MLVSSIKQQEKKRLAPPIHLLRRTLCVSCTPTNDKRNHTHLWRLSELKTTSVLSSLAMQGLVAKMNGRSDRWYALEGRMHFAATAEDTQEEYTASQSFAGGEAPVLSFGASEPRLTAEIRNDGNAPPKTGSKIREERKAASTASERSAPKKRRSGRTEEEHDGSHHDDALDLDDDLGGISLSQESSMSLSQGRSKYSIVERPIKHYRKRSKRS